jgi:DNA polymerase-3 subunit delta'
LEDSKQIKIEQIRDVIDWAMQTAQQGGNKICIIDPADALNIQSANALLKSLEEPPPNTTIVLVTDQPAKLLATLRSRCQKIECHLPERDEALAWLQQHETVNADVGLLLEIAGGVPLRVINSIDEEYLQLRQSIVKELIPLAQGVRSPLQIAAGLTKQDPGTVLDVVFHLVSDSISYTMSEGKVLRNHDIETQLAGYADSFSVGKRYQLLDRVASAKKALMSTSNANPQMLLEWVFSTAA